MTFPTSSDLSQYSPPLLPLFSYPWEKENDPPNLPISPLSFEDTYFSPILPEPSPFSFQTWEKAPITIPYPNLPSSPLSNAKNYKTELCKNFTEIGSCSYGKKCRYAHGPEELQQRIRPTLFKSRICINFILEGYCSFGSRCRFSHKLPTPPQSPLPIFKELIKKGTAEFFKQSKKAYFF
ncbi:MAG: zinc finger CCCH domain-containing protein [Chlamydiota bacterium]